uniref:Ribosomal protein L20 n=1 Tax=Lepocinclis tripteris TaxID=135494 RepID=A0A3G3LL72_9EUGL|nr:ribosomal protein L20 [Lepocinclis tripteris]
MTRIKGGVILHKRHKKIIKQNKTFKGSHSRLFKVVNQQYIRSLHYSFGSRRKRKPYNKRIWIQQINGESRKSNFKYNKIKTNLQKAKIKINTKILSKICIKDKNTFNYLLNIK